MPLLLVFLISVALGAQPASAQQLTLDGHRLSVSCGLPKRGAIARSEDRALRFRLDAGDVGKCDTDRKEFRSDTWYKPYSERAEAVVETVLRNGKTHKIAFEARIVAGYTESDRNETFFQIKDCPDSRVPVMGFLRRSHAQQFAFHLGEGEFVRTGSPVPLATGRWYRFDILYTNASPSRLSISVDGRPILRDRAFANVNACGRTRFRIGIYRGGSKTRNLASSVIEYRNLAVN